MRRILSKFCGVCLSLALFAVVGCTDYAADIQKVNDDLGNSVASLEKTIEDLEKQMKDNYALKSELDQLETELNGTIDTKIADVNKAIAAVKTIAEKNSSDITALQTALAAANQEIAGLKTLVDTKADKTEVDQLRTDLTNKINGVQSALDAFKTEVNGKITDINGKIAALDTRIGDLESTVDIVKGQVAALQQTVAEHTTKIETLITDCNDLKERMTGAEGDIAANTAAIEAEVEAREAAITAVEGKIAAVKTALEEHIEAYNLAIKALQDKDVEQDGLISELQGKVSANEKAIEALQKEDERLAGLIDKVKEIADANKTEIGKIQKKLGTIDTEISTIKGNIDTINAKVKTLEGDVQGLLNRVQSLVYVPEYDDGKANISAASISNGTQIIYIPKTDVITYKVSPVEFAEDLANLAADVFTFDVKDVKTRAAEAPALEILNAEGDKTTGKIKFTVRAVDFADGFYAGTPDCSYSVSLNLNQDVEATEDTEAQSRHIASCYTNLLPAVDAIVPVLVYKGVEKPGEVVAVDGHMFPYNLKEDVFVPFEKCELNFKVGTELKTLDELVAAGYAVTVEPSCKITNTAPCKTCFVAEVDGDKLSETALNIHLADHVDASKVGHFAVASYSYAINGSDDFVYTWTSNLRVVKAQVDATAASEVKWSYDVADDVEGDRVAFVASYGLTTPVAPKSKRTISYDVNDLVKSKNFPDDINLYEIAGIAPTSIEVNEVATDGTKTNVTQAVPATLNKDTKKDVIKVVLEDFEWRKVYEVKVTYSDSKRDVNYIFTITTVDRSRDAIVLKTANTVKEYVKNMTILKGQIEYPLNGIYALLKEGGNLCIDVDAVKATEKQYLDDIFATTPVDHAYSLTYGNSPVATPKAIMTNIFGTPRGAGIYVNAANQKFSPEYNYAWFKDVVVKTVVPMDKTIYTYYGQEIKIEHEIDFTTDIYDYKHVKEWVVKNDEEVYSDVNGRYTPGIASTAVSDFTTANVRLNDAFNIINKKTGVALTAAEITAAGLKSTFEVEDTYTGTGVAVNPATNELSYNDTVDFVDVAAQLVIENDPVGADPATYVVLPTSFDAGEVYADYIVKKYDPIADPVAKNTEVKVVDSKEYVVNMLDYITLTDNRHGFAPNYSLIKDGAWVNGNGANGYASGVDVEVLYNLGITYSAVLDNIDLSIRPLFSFDPTTGVLKFNAMNDIVLQEPIVVPVKMTIAYTWAVKSVEFNVTFFRN